MPKLIIGADLRPRRLLPSRDVSAFCLTGKEVWAVIRSLLRLCHW